MRPVKAFDMREGKLTIDELAECMGRSVRTVHRFIKLGLPYEREGKRFLFDSEHVRVWLEAECLVASVVSNAGVAA
jgi:excisionase family DNA binding protein